MHNKKIKSSVAALALGAIIIGGTFAWFHASDIVTNSFKTLGPTTPDDSNYSKIRIYEVFNQETALKGVAVGTPFNKDAQVKNISKYDSLIRVKLTPTIEDEHGNTLDSSKVDLQFTNLYSGSGDIQQGTWVKNGDYYYFVGKVQPDGFTNQLLDSVTVVLDDDTRNNPNYMNASYDVKIEAESVQASLGAIIDTNDGGFGLTKNSALANALEAAVNATAVNKGQIEGSYQVNS